jgi:uncharacterized protein (DUF1499 family)
MPEKLKVTDCPNSPNCVSTRACRESAQMEPLPISREPEEIRKAIKKAVGEFKRTKILDESEHYLHFTFKTAVFRFVDDVEFEIDSEERLLHFRSASRLGYSDLGVNRKRMEKLVRRLRGRV